MNGKTYAALAAVAFVVILGMQIYAMVIVNSNLNQSFGKGRLTMPPLQIPFRHESSLSTSPFEEVLLKDNSWDFYQKMQFVQNKIQRILNYSRFNINALAEDNLINTSDAELQEKSDQYIVTVNAPTADESAIKVNLDDRILSIAIKTKTAKNEKDGKHSYRESSAGEFEQVLTLPGSGDAAKMTTDFHNGILTIVIPKSLRSGTRSVLICRSDILGPFVPKG
ncbi:Hsp20 family protein [Crenothrix sp.]|uniref:Hsp20 family protein n=1 Tax=Crenothrix sp. TaxID=3100433 RepID=UPI00374C8F3B